MLRIIEKISTSIESVFHFINKIGLLHCLGASRSNSQELLMSPISSFSALLSARLSSYLCPAGLLRGLLIIPFSMSWILYSLPGQTQTAQSHRAVATSAAPDNSEWIQTSIQNFKQSKQQWIQVNLSEQRLTAWEGSTPVYSVTVSTGRASDATPAGVYAIQTKYRTTRMQGEHEGQAYDIPDVPYAMYFSGNYAIHGAYWHRNFGTPVSSGCVNMPVEGAEWLFGWASPGTPVVVQK